MESILKVPNDIITAPTAEEMRKRLHALFEKGDSFVLAAVILRL